MPRKQVSEFHRAIQGTAHETLKDRKIRLAIEEACDAFRITYPNSKPWERLCGIRDHVNALLAAHRDLESVRRDKVLEDVRGGKYKDDPKSGFAALESLDDNPVIIPDLYGEIERQGIPEN